jgi:hypothetical protein
MIRRAALALALITALVGLLSTEAVALRGRHSTQITITSSDLDSGEAVVQGKLSSSYRNCTRYRQVGLFVGNTLIDTALSDTYGNFTLRGPSSSGNHTVYAYREYAVGRCGHLCKLARVDFGL